MSDNAHKIPLARSLNAIARNRANDAVQVLGKALPCSVVSVQSSSIVTVKFEIHHPPYTLPHVKVALFGPEYIRYPIQPGDKGILVPADARLGGINGLGSGTADLTQPANLSNAAFLPIGNADWEEVLGGAVVFVAPQTITTGNLIAGTGATGSFSTPTGQTVTVKDGIITNIF